MTKRELQIYRQGMFYAARLARFQLETKRVWEREQKWKHEHAMNSTTDWPPGMLVNMEAAVERYRDAIRARAAELLKR